MGLLANSGDFTKHWRVDGLPLKAKTLARQGLSVDEIVVRLQLHQAIVKFWIELPLTSEDMASFHWWRKIADIPTEYSDKDSVNKEEATVESLPVIDSSQTKPLPYPYNDSNKFSSVESVRGKKVSSVLPFQSSKFKILYVCRERQGEFVPSARMAELSGVALDSTRSLLSSWMRFPVSRRYVCRRPLAVSGSLQYGYALKWAGYHFLKTLESKRPLWVSVWLSELPTAR